MGRLAGLPFLLLGCAAPVADYCDAQTPCAASLQVCLLPEHACAPAIAWGELSGAQATPPTPSDLSGSIKIAKNDGGVLVYDLSFGRQLPARGRPADITAHLHAGAPGEISQSLGILSPGLGALDWLSDDQVIGLRAGALYVDLHSAAFESSEARAQIWPLDEAGAGRAEVQATLSPRQEPTPRDLSSLGSATLAYDGGSGAGDYRLAVEGVQGVVAEVHLHRGVYGTEGDRLVDLSPPGPGAAVSDRFTQDHVLEQDRTLLPVLLRSGVVYVNVHTAAYPAGELRGQLLSPVAGAVASPFGAILSPDRISPPVASVAAGTASFVLSPDRRWLTYFIVHTVVGATGARFSMGNPGPKILDLPPDQSMGTLPTSAAGGLPLADLLSGAIYLSILSPAHPEGEVRGPLRLP